MNVDYFWNSADIKAEHMMALSCKDSFSGPVYQQQQQQQTSILRIMHVTLCIISLTFIKFLSQNSFKIHGTMYGI